MGNLYYAQNQVEKAISIWTVALISRPEDATTCLNLAVAFNKKNMKFESIKYFEKYLKYEENKSSEEYKRVKNQIQTCYQVANECLITGAQLHSENQTEKAANYYFKCLANYPNLSKANLNLGSIFFSNKNLELAIKYWLVASHIEPNYEKVYSNLAIAYDMNRQFDYAYCNYYKYMNFLINKNENLVESHLILAKKHLANNEFYEAIDEYKNYSILNPTEKETNKELIKKLETYLNPEAAIIENCFKRGNELINAGHFAEAKLYFFRIMKLSSPQLLEFSKAKAKYSQCEKSEVGMR